MLSIASLLAWEARRPPHTEACGSVTPSLSWQQKAPCLCDYLALHTNLCSGILSAIMYSLETTLYYYEMTSYLICYDYVLHTPLYAAACCLCVFIHCRTLALFSKHLAACRQCQDIPHGRPSLYHTLQMDHSSSCTLTHSMPKVCRKLPRTVPLSWWV